MVCVPWQYFPPTFITTDMGILFNIPHQNAWYLQKTNLRFILTRGSSIAISEKLAIEMWQQRKRDAVIIILLLRSSTKNFTSCSTGFDA